MQKRRVVRTTVYEGHIITCNEKMDLARFFVEERGVISYVGDELPEQYAALPRVQLGMRALMPAFCDTHMHFSSFALFDATLDVRDAISFADLEARIVGHVNEKKPKLVLAFGISAHSVSEQALVTREHLDKMPVSCPVMLIKYDGHASVVNTRMLEMLPEKVRQVRGFNEITGQLFQEAYFLATDFVTGKVAIPDLLRNMIRGIDTLAGYGIGLIHTVEGIGFPLDMDVSISKLLARGIWNRFQMRIFFQTMSIKKVTKKRLPRIGGCFETALDGCFGSQDAALLSPYLGSDNKGILYYTDAQVMKFIENAHRAGLQASVHAIGDAAFEQALTVFEKVLAAYPKKDHRHTIIHACMTTDEQLQRAGRLGLLLSVQPAFIHWPLEPQNYLTSLIGERANSLNRLRAMLDAGIIISGGSDAPCTVPNPILGIHCACNHSNPSESITIGEALRMYTWAGAHAAFDENKRGSLEIGKIADFILLNQNPLTTDKKQLHTLKVEQLFLEGKPYQKGQTLGKLLWQGIFGQKVKC